MIQRLLPYVLVGAGGFVGANARYLVARWVGSAVDARFPLGTFLINVSGSFLLGLLGALLAERFVPHADGLRLALGVGFLGAFTTFSTFEYETERLTEAGTVLWAGVNVVTSVVAGFVAVRLGVAVAR